MTLEEFYGTLSPEEIALIARYIQITEEQGQEPEWVDTSIDRTPVKGSVFRCREWIAPRPLNEIRPTDERRRVLVQSAMLLFDGMARLRSRPNGG